MDGFKGTRVAPYVSVDIQTDHIHEGIGYEFSRSGTLGSESSYIFTGTIGDLPAHLHGFSISVSAGPVTIELIEEPTVTVAGTLVPGYNMNRVSENLASTELRVGATINGGTVLSTRTIHDIGGGAHIEGGGAGFGTGWVLKPNTVYAIRITTGTIVGGISWNASFYWFEHAAL